MSEVDQPCQELCTAIASLKPTPFTALNVCDFPTNRPLSDVVVQDCTIVLAILERLSEDTVILSVLVTIDFTYASAGPDGNTVSNAGRCDTTVQIKLKPVEEGFTLAEVPCSGTLECQARDAGFDPSVGAQQFIVTLTGSLSCYGCQNQIVNTQLCSSAVSPTTGIPLPWSNGRSEDTLKWNFRCGHSSETAPE